ncbi:MAG TPA: winged helix-turn-helix domain-containing protein [Steroidobacteraceae bacterium]|nr:winged helix-turn-helix domain-containing protein [Steroidobacteraceae bacterium]
MTMQEHVVRLRFDRFELDEADARLTCAGVPVPLAPTPFAVLCTLARTPCTLMRKQALLDAVWGHRFVTDSALKQAISEVRAALGDDPKQPRYIATVARRGYRFIGTAVHAPCQSAPAVERSGTGEADHATLAALNEQSHGDPVVADLVRAVRATQERERLVLHHLDVCRKMLLRLIDLAEGRPDELQPVSWHAYARALD